MEEELILTSYDCKYYDSLVPGKDQCMIHLWCFDKYTNPYLLRIENFFIEIYIEFYNTRGRLNTRVDWTPEKMRMIAQEMESQTGVEMLSYKPMQRHLLYFYKGDDNLTCVLRARFRTRREKSAFTQHLKQNGLVTNEGRLYFGFHESFVNPIQRFHNKYGLKYSQWFRIKAKGVRKSRKMSTLPREYYGNRHTLVPIPLSETETWKLRPLVLSFDIEVNSHNVKTFPDECDKRDPAFMVGFVVWRDGDPVDNLTKIGLIYGDCPDDPYVDKIIRTDTEREFMRMFYKIFNAINPDVVTGYNICNFDMYYLKIRTESYCGMDIPLLGRLNFRPPGSEGYYDSSWGSSANKRIGVKCFSMPGVIILDPYHYVFRELPKVTSYKLGDVSKQWLGGEDKDPITPEFMFITFGKWFRNRKERRTSEYRKIVEDMGKIMHYCIVDCVLPVKLLQKFGLLMVIRERSSIFGVPPERIFMFGTGKKTESQVVTSAYINKYIINSYQARILKSVGAFVFPALGGMWEFVMTNDFNSLYPSIAIAFNLCWTTLLYWNDVEDMDEDDYYTFPTGRTDGSPTHLYFVKPHIRKGIFPDILAKLLSARKATRDALKYITDKDQKKLYDSRQLALKIGANSGYGFTASNYSKFPCREIAEAICLIGRREITTVSKKIEEVFHGKTVSGDTDSYMISISHAHPSKDADVAFGIGKQIETFMNGKPEEIVDGVVIPAVKGLFMPPLAMAVEGYRKMFILKKKHYIYAEYQHDKREPDYGQLKRDKKTGKIILNVKGVTPVKKENCLWIRQMFIDLCQLFFEGCVFEDCINLMMREVARYMNGKVAPEELVMISSMGGNYSNENAKLKLFSERLAAAGTPVETGEILDYVILDKKSKYQGDKCYLLREYNKLLDEGEDVSFSDEFYIGKALGKIASLIQLAFDPEKKAKWSHGRKGITLENMNEYIYRELVAGVKLRKIRDDILEFYSDSKDDIEIENIR